MLQERAFVLSASAVRGRRITMVCTDRLKYAVLDDGQGYLLYDLISDPQERNNLVGHPDMRSIEAEMRERQRQLVRHGDLAGKL
jgi:hypothetical protein